jgi:hypothetical protein
MSILRKNAALFSRATYKLHFQFTILLAAQVTQIYRTTFKAKIF